MRRGVLPIIILHGWGLSGEAYQGVKTLLEREGFEVLTPDLPGFGSEKLRKHAMRLDDYVSFVEDFMKRKRITKVILIGHSFGGRVAIKYALMFPKRTYALILTGAPGITHRLSLFRRAIMRAAVAFGELFRFRLLSPFRKAVRKGLYFFIGEWDYYYAGDLRETFKLVVSEALQDFLPSIRVPTLLLWGERDAVIPLSDAWKMRRLIPKAKLSTVKNVGHKLPYEDEEAFTKEVVEFLRRL